MPGTPANFAPTPRVLLAVDLSNQIYRACHAHALLQDNGVFTGGFYGFLQSVSKAIDVSRATDIIICRDTKPYRRSLIYPAYKQLRKTTQDPRSRAMYDETEPQVLDFLDAFGIPCWALSGFESDDLIAACVIQQRFRMESVVAMSNDSDLYQLFGYPGFRIYKDAQHPLLRRQDTLDKSGLTPEEFILTSALSGTHNEVEGLAGVGPVTATKIVKDPAKLRQYWHEHRELMQRNVALISLPHPELPRMQIPLLTMRGRFDARAMYRFCARFNIDVMPWWVEAFIQVLN